jgi:hypothetical protein
MSLFIHKIDHGFLDKSHTFVEESPSKKNEGAYANKFVSRNGPSGVCISGILDLLWPSL